MPPLGVASAEAESASVTIESMSVTSLVRPARVVTPAGVATAGTAAAAAEPPCCRGSKLLAADSNI